MLRRPPAPNPPTAATAELRREGNYKRAREAEKEARIFRNLISKIDHLRGAQDRARAFAAASCS